jgi:8-oxo-dGTP diphosphatase
LGPSVKYKLGSLIVLMRHERQENGKNVRIFAVGYTATFIGGQIQLSEQHTEYEWVPIKTFKPDKYFTGGWLEGVKEYLAKSRHT